MAQPNNYPRNEQPAPREFDVTDSSLPPSLGMVARHIRGRTLDPSYRPASRGPVEIPELPSPAAASLEGFVQQARARGNGLYNGPLGPVKIEVVASLVHAKFEFSAHYPGTDGEPDVVLPITSDLTISPDSISYGLLSHDGYLHASEVVKVTGARDGSSPLRMEAYTAQMRTDDPMLDPLRVGREPEDGAGQMNVQAQLMLAALGDIAAPDAG